MAAIRQFMVWMNCHRHMEKRDPKVFRILNRSRHEKVIDPEKVQTLVELLGIDRNHAYNILRGYESVALPSKDRLVATHSFCLELGIDNETMQKYTDFLRMQPNALEQRIGFYKDLGCLRVEPSLILRYMAGLRATPNDLKEQKLLPPDADVVGNLLSCLPDPPPDVPPVDRPSDDEGLDTIHKSLLSHYLMWKLELTEDQLNRMMKTQSTFGYPSFTLFRETMDILLDDFEFTKAKIIRNSFVLSRTPRSIRMLLKEVPKIANTDIKSIIRKYPRILSQRSDGLREKLHVLRTCDVPEEAIVRIPSTLSLSSKTLVKRIEEFKSMPDLAGHWKNPKMLLMICNFEGVKRHLEKLKKLKIRLTSIYVLCSGDKLFEKYTQFGVNPTKSKDVLNFLAKELDKDECTIRMALKRNPLWCQVPFIYVQETYGFLKQNHFSNEAIFNNLPLLLHRSTQVERYLKNMDLKRIDKPSELTESRKLALCTYDIEKQYHFNGSGVWNCEQNEDLSMTSYEMNQERRMNLKRFTIDII